MKGNESTKTYELYCENHQNQRHRFVKRLGQLIVVPNSNRLRIKCFVPIIFV